MTATGGSDGLVVGVGVGVPVGVGVGVGLDGVGLGVAGADGVGGGDCVEVGVGVGVRVGVGVGVGVEVGVGLGDGVGAPGQLIVMVAPLAEVAVVVTFTPVKGSVNERPTPSGESSNDGVPGVVSSSSDWTFEGSSGATRIVTPFTTAAVVAKLS